MNEEGSFNLLLFPQTYGKVSAIALRLMGQYVAQACFIIYDGNKYLFLNHLSQLTHIYLPNHF